MTEHELHAFYRRTIPPYGSSVPLDLTLGNLRVRVWTIDWRCLRTRAAARRTRFTASLLPRGNEGA